MLTRRASRPPHVRYAGHGSHGSHGARHSRARASLSRSAAARHGRARASLSRADDRPTLLSQSRRWSRYAPLPVPQCLFWPRQAKRAQACAKEITSANNVAKRPYRDSDFSELHLVKTCPKKSVLALCLQNIDIKYVTFDIVFSILRYRILLYNIE